MRCHLFRRAISPVTTHISFIFFLNANIFYHIYSTTKKKINLKRDDIVARKCQHVMMLSKRDIDAHNMIGRKEGRKEEEMKEGWKRKERRKDGKKRRKEGEEEGRKENGRKKGRRERRKEGGKKEKKERSKEKKRGRKKGREGEKEGRKEGRKRIISLIQLFYLY